MKWRATEHGIEPVQEPGEPAAAFIFASMRQYRAYRRAGGQRHFIRPQRPVDVRKAYWPGITQMMRLSLEGTNFRKWPNIMEEATQQPTLIPVENNQSIRTIKGTWRKLLSFFGKG